MDALSDVMTALRTGKPFAGRFARRAPWGSRYEAEPDAFGVQVMVRGSAVVTAPGGTTFELAEGDALLIPRGGAHTLADAPGSPLEAPCAQGRGAVVRTAPAEEERATHIALAFSYELVRSRSHPLLTSMPDYVHLPADAEARPGLTDAIAMLDRELQHRHSGGDAIVPALLDAVLMYLLRGWIGRCAGGCRFDGWAAALADDSIAGALEAIHADPARQWTVASLGAAAGLSRSAFSRKFTELVGQPPLAYLTAWRMTLAARLLSESDAPLSSVSRRVGYASEFAFAAAFKRAFGTPPGQFRRQAAPREDAVEPVPV